VGWRDTCNVGSGCQGVEGRIGIIWGFRRRPQVTVGFRQHLTLAKGHWRLGVVGGCGSFVGDGLGIFFFRVTICEGFRFGSGVIVGFRVVRGVFTALFQGDEAGDSGEGVGKAQVEVGLVFGGLRAKGVGEQELAELGDGELKADFGEVGRVFGAEQAEQRILLEGGGVELGLELKPILVAAAVPIGNVPRRDVESKLGESGGDVAVRGTVIEHLVNETAVGFGEGSDFAVAPAIYGRQFTIYERGELGRGGAHTG